jgi:hypothetical protein
MRLRVEPAAARERLAARIEWLGGVACVAGTSLELSYPAGEFEDQDQEQTELTFFVRAWLSDEPDVEAEVLA